MRKRSLDMVHALAKRDERVVFIGSDLSPNLLGEMKKEFPSRYYMEGIAEANIIGMAAGMAMDGFVPYVNTIATFITRRCYEQVAVDLCLNDLPVRRLGKGGDPVISKPERGFAIGKAIDMIDGETGASDVLLIATGVATTQALKAAGSLAADSIRCRLLHLHTVKPIDADAIVDAAAETKLVVTVEEHSVVGGLGSAVLETLSDRLTGALPPLKRLGIPDKFADHYGSQAKLMEDFRFDAKGIDATVRKLRAELGR